MFTLLFVSHILSLPELAFCDPWVKISLHACNWNSFHLTVLISAKLMDGCQEVMTGSVTTHAKEINPSWSDCLLRADFQTRVIYKACTKICNACGPFLFNQCCRWLPKKNDKFLDFSSFIQGIYGSSSNTRTLTPIMFFSLHHICLYVTCLTKFWPSNFYASSLSEYFAKRIEEKREIEKQEKEKKEEEEAAKVISPASGRSAATPKQKKGRKPGFTLFNFNIFCNTDIEKGPKRHPVSCSKGLVTLSWPFWSQQFLQ